MSTPPRLATLDYLAEVAKDWALSSFAAAEDSTFVLTPHRFELDGHTVRRRRLSTRSREASGPLAAVRRVRDPVAWARSDIVTLLADSESGSVEYQQEIVEILGAEEDDVLAEAAFVIRIPGFPPASARSARPPRLSASASGVAAHRRLALRRRAGEDPREDRRPPGSVDGVHEGDGQPGGVGPGAHLP